MCSCDCVYLNHCDAYTRRFFFCFFLPKIISNSNASIRYSELASENDAEVSISLHFVFFYYFHTRETIPMWYQLNNNSNNNNAQYSCVYTHATAHILQGCCGRRQNKGIEYLSSTQNIPYCVLYIVSTNRFLSVPRGDWWRNTFADETNIKRETRIYV